MRHGIIRHKQAVGVFVLRCVVHRSRHCRCELIGVHRSGIGKGNIVQGGVRHGNCSRTVSGVYRSGNIFAGEVKPVCPTGGKVELLGKAPLCRQCDVTCDCLVELVFGITVVPAYKVISGFKRRRDRCDHLIAACHNLKCVAAVAIHKCHGVFFNTTLVDTGVEYTAVDFAVIADITCKGSRGIACAENSAGIAGQGCLPCYSTSVGVKVAYTAASAGQSDITFYHTARRQRAVCMSCGWIAVNKSEY